VVVVPEETKDGKPDAFLGCLLQTPDCLENGLFLLLGEAIKSTGRLRWNPNLKDRMQSKYEQESDRMAIGVYADAIR